jgi:DNA-directed RNA polymerase subunit RPC12/RpoP
MAGTTLSYVCVALLWGFTLLVLVYAFVHPDSAVNRMLPEGVWGIILICVLNALVLLPLWLPVLTASPPLEETMPDKDSVYVECQNCGAAYRYAPSKVDYDNKVECQNCGRKIDLQGEPDINQQSSVWAS